MMRTKLPLAAAFLVTASLTPVASAATKPAVVWIPTAPVELTPSGAFATQCAKTGLSGSAVAAGCVRNIDEPTTFTPHPSAQQLADGIAAAFSAYDLRVVTEAPPPYLPTFAVFTSADVDEDSTSHTCSSSSANCAALQRDRAAFTNAGTPFCTAPDLLASAVFAVGAMAGLEGKSATPDDWMNYPPDFMAPPTQFVDACGAIAPPLGGPDGTTPLPLQCTSLDHTGCSAQQQNSHADLLANLGPASADDQAPILEVTSPTDGVVLGPGDPVLVSFTLDEASHFAGARVTIASDALLRIPGVESGEITFCTSDLCDVNWLDGDPFKTTDSPWSTSEIHGLPPGEYEIVIEASDYYGNEAPTVAMVVQVVGDPVDPTGGSSSGTGDTDTGGADTGPLSTTGVPMDPSDGWTTAPGDDGGPTDPEDPSAGDSSDSGAPAATDGLGGRGCSSDRDHGPRGSAVLLLALLGLRRRRS